MLDFDVLKKFRSILVNTQIAADPSILITQRSITQLSRNSMTVYTKSYVAKSGLLDKINSGEEVLSHGQLVPAHPDITCPALLETSVGNAGWGVRGTLGRRGISPVSKSTQKPVGRAGICRTVRRGHLLGVLVPPHLLGSTRLSVRVQARPQLVRKPLRRVIGSPRPDSYSVDLVGLVGWGSSGCSLPCGLDDASQRQKKRSVKVLHRRHPRDLNSPPNTN